MKQGEMLGDFMISTKPTNAGGGKCVWAFATRGGEEYFIKEFLDPKWPLDSSPGNPESKRLRRAECAIFEQRHQNIMERLRSDAVGGGNIVVAEAFFRDRTTYYKVTKRIDASNLESLELLAAHQKGVVLRTLGFSLQQLHRIGIVHGDLKPDNVLVQRRPASDLYTAKLIDFDDSYLAGRPPEPSTVAGDSYYCAPEWLAYVKDEGRSDGAELTAAVDMFALGLMLHKYLTGQLPAFPPGYSSPGEAVKDGQPLNLSHQLHPEIARLIMTLTDVRSRRRPNIELFLQAIDDDATLNLSAAPAASPEPAVPARPAGRLKINMGPGGSAASSAAADPGARRMPPRDTSGDELPVRPSRLRIHIDTKAPGRRSSPPGE